MGTRPAVDVRSALDRAVSAARERDEALRTARDAFEAVLNEEIKDFNERAGEKMLKISRASVSFDSIGRFQVKIEDLALGGSPFSSMFVSRSKHWIVEVLGERLRRRLTLREDEVYVYLDKRFYCSP